MVRICDIISILVSIGLLVGYFESSKAWYMNDIICVGIVGTCIKMLKITNLK